MEPPSSKAFSKSKHQLAKNRDRSHGRGGRGHSGKQQPSQASRHPQPGKGQHAAQEPTAAETGASAAGEGARGRDLKTLLDDASQFYATPSVRQSTLMASLAAHPFLDVPADDVPAQVRRVNWQEPLVSCSALPQLRWTALPSKYNSGFLRHTMWKVDGRVQ